MTGKRTARAVVGVAVAALVATIAPNTAVAEELPDPVRYELPRPSGPYQVGVIDLHLVDRSRVDPWVPDSVREVMATVRYPAVRGTGEPAPYLTPGAARAMAESDAAQLGINPEVLDYTFDTHSRVGARALGGDRPVVVYSPGAEMPRSLGTVQLEELTSRGYVTVAIDHTHEATAVEFPDGRVAEGVLGEWELDTARTMMDTRVDDVRFVLDQLEVLARGGNPDAADRPLPRGLGRALDLSRVGMFGHSGGGFTTGEVMLDDRRVDAGANLDGSMAYSQEHFAPVAREGLDRPFLLMSAGDHSEANDPSWQEFLRNHHAWLLRLHLPEGEHFSYTDHQLLLPQLTAHLGVDPTLTARIIGTVDGERSMRSQVTYLAAFFDRHLRGIPQWLLAGPSPAHPDVEFLR